MALTVNPFLNDIAFGEIVVKNKRGKTPSGTITEQASQFLPDIDTTPLKARFLKMELRRIFGAEEAHTLQEMLDRLSTFPDFLGDVDLCQVARGLMSSHVTDFEKERLYFAMPSQSIQVGHEEKEDRILCLRHRKEEGNIKKLCSAIAGNRKFHPGSTFLVAVRVQPSKVIALSPRSFPDHWKPAEATI